MKLKLISKKILKGIPSASGIEIYKNKLYIIGDDSAWLFILDRQLKLIEKIPLLKKRKRLSEARIPKKKKPDFEAMTFVKYKGEKILLIFGSGSKRIKRDKLFAVYPSRKHEVKEYSLTSLYDYINDGKRKTSELNIEGVAATDKRIWFLERRTAKRRNMFYSFDLKQVMDFLFKKERKRPRDIRIGRFDLPSINTIEAGVSGAAMINKYKMIFTASVEDTENAIDDGDILGSFIGIRNFKSYEVNAEVLEKGNNTLKLKVESICILKSKNKTHQLLAVTDSDGGVSELLELELKE